LPGWRLGRAVELDCVRLAHSVAPGSSASSAAPALISLDRSSSGQDRSAADPRGRFHSGLRGRVYRLRPPRHRGRAAGLPPTRRGPRRRARSHVRRHVGLRRPRRHSAEDPVWCPVRSWSLLFERRRERQRHPPLARAPATITTDDYLCVVQANATGRFPRNGPECYDDPQELAVEIGLIFDAAGNRAVEAPYQDRCAPDHCRAMSEPDCPVFTADPTMAHQSTTAILARRTGVASIPTGSRSRWSPWSTSRTTRRAASSSTRNATPRGGAIRPSRTISSSTVASGRRPPELLAPQAARRGRPALGPPRRRRPRRGTAPGRTNVPLCGARSTLAEVWAPVPDLERRVRTK
jgi:hypothetical protein